MFILRVGADALIRPQSLKTPFLSPWKETGFFIPKERRQGKFPLNPSGTVFKLLRSIVALSSSLLAPRFGGFSVPCGTPPAVTLALQVQSLVFCHCVGGEEKMFILHVGAGR